MSNDLGNQASTNVPPATRFKRAGWRDPRLWLGVLLVTVSVVAGARLLAAADDTVPVWVADSALGAGSEVAESDLEVRRVRFAGGEGLDHYVLAEDRFPAGQVLLRGVGAGELVPRSALASREDVDLLHVPLEVEPHQVPPAVAAGSVIDVYLTDGPGGDVRQGSGPSLEAVAVVSAPSVEEGFAISGARQLVVAVPEDDAVAFQGEYAALDDPSVRVLQRS